MFHDLQGGLERYAALVRAWGARIDLVSPADLERFEERHIGDCLRAAPLLAELAPGPAVDVGSGAGLPGIPLALADPQRPWRLLEPRARRAAFLDEVVRDLGLDCEVVRATAEEAARDPRLRGAHALATARAVAPPAAAFGLLGPLLAQGGIGLVFVGSGAELPPGSREWAPGLAIVRA